MSKDFNWKPYYIGAAIVALFSCLFSWKIGFGIALGSLFFFINDKLNQKRFPSLDSNSKAIGSIIGIGFIQFIMIAIVAIISYYVGKLPAFFGAFAGMTIPHFYFMFKELRNIKK